jgi:ElaB/YqjD/DUF883 family membrane-anchored ribosome-binding protein
MRDHEKSIEMIEQDMARSRAEIGRTTETLKSKVEPESLADAARQVILESTQRVEERVKQLADAAPTRMESLGEQALDYFQQNPVPALLAGMGIGLLISLAERDVVSSHVASAGGGPVAGRLNRTMAGNPRLMRAQRRTLRSARRANRQHPLLLGAAALGAGLLLGSLLPNTRKEHELLGPTRDRLLETGKESAQEAMQQARGAVEQELEQRKADLAEAKESVEETALRAYNEARDEALAAREIDAGEQTPDQIVP